MREERQAHTQSLLSLALRFQPRSRPFVWLLARTWIRKNTDCFAVYNRMEIWKCWLSQRGEIGVPGENLFEQGKNQYQTQATYGLASGTQQHKCNAGGLFLAFHLQLTWKKRPRLLQALTKQTYMWEQIVMSQFEFLTRPTLLVY